MSTNHFDVMLVGAGIMSATLGTLLKKLAPELRICMVERLEGVALESTSGWNNAGTGHAAYCELNYTPERPDGSINIDKALAINTSFEVSLQFWSSLINQGDLPDAASFIHPVPHVSFVWGADNVAFLRKRYAAMQQSHLFADMEYSEDHAVLSEWVPLIMAGRDPSEPIAGTRVAYGSDVNFGALARHLVNYLDQHDDFELLLNHEVKFIDRLEDKSWQLTIRDLNTAGPANTQLTADFVFLGAGGGTLPLLQLSNIPEGHGYGGFPVSGRWLVCRDPDIVEKHHAKVYGKASIGAPPMSVPHLDTRVIDGEHALLFGPFAGFTTKFLKEGQLIDLLETVHLDNLLPMLKVGVTNIDLIRYLITEVLHTHGSRIKSLRGYYPEVNKAQWSLKTAGQRVQVIKKDPATVGKLEFGTEVVAAADGSLAALLGASPGASVSVTAMLHILERCFAERMASAEWQATMQQLIPSYGQSLLDNAELLASVRAHNLSTLGLQEKADLHDRQARIAV